MKQNFFLLLSFIVLSISCKKEENNKYIPFLQKTYIKGYQGEITGLYLNEIPWRNTSSYAQAVYGIVTPDSICGFKNTGAIVIASFAQGIDSLRGFAFRDTFSFSRELFAFSSIPTHEGKYFIKKNINNECKMNSTAGEILIAQDGDVIAGEYELYEPRNLENSITITKYDTYTGDVYGNFDVTFIKKRLDFSSYPWYTDIAHFYGGTFHTKWIK